MTNAETNRAATRHLVDALAAMDRTHFYAAKREVRAAIAILIADLEAIEAIEKAERIGALDVI